MHKVKIIIIGLIFITLGIISILILNKTSSAINTEQPIDIIVQLGWLHNPQFAGFYVAKEEGYYQEAGLRVSFKEYEEGLNQIDDLVNGKVDFGVSTPVEILPSLQNGKQVKAIAVIYQTAPWAIAAPAASNIQTPADFKNKRLGAKGDNNEAKIKYIALLNKYGVKSADSEIIGLDYTMDEADDLLNKRADVIDVYRTDQPYLMRQKGIAFSLLLPEDFGVAGYGDTLITTNSLIESKPALVKKFVDATLRGWQYAADNPEKTLEITMQYANKTYNNSERARFILQQSIPLIRPKAGGSIGAMNPTAWAEIAKAMEDAGVLAEGLDISQAFTTQFIK